MLAAAGINLLCNSDIILFSIGFYMNGKIFKVESSFLPPINPFNYKAFPPTLL